MQTDKLNLQGHGLKLSGFKEIHKGSVVYSFDLTIENWGITIKECKWMDSKGSQFLSFPSRQYEDNGQKKYMSYIFIEKEKKDKLDISVKTLIDEQFKGIPKT